MTLFNSAALNRSKYQCLLLFLLFSCKTHPNSDRHFADGNENKVYKLRLNPAAEAKYYFNISSGSEFKMELNDKKVDNDNKSDLGVTYAIDKDSAGDYVFNIGYDKIHLYTKSVDAETDLDADNGTNSVIPEEKMLAAVKEAHIRALISPAGEVKTISGYKEIAGTILAKFNATDPATREKLQKQWDQMVGDGVIKKNMDQLLRLFPDSAVHVGDRWKLSGTQKDGIPVHSKGSYVLQDIKDGVALIHSEAEMSSDSSMVQLMGYDVLANLKGRQEGEYEMETATGILQTARTTAHIEGTIGIMGREIPVTIETSVTIKGRKLK